jgi:hypothetical protein
MSVDFTSITLTDVTTTSATVSWDAVIGNVDGYAVLITPTTGGAKAEPGKVRGTPTTSLKYLTAGQLYMVIIRTEYSGKRSAASIHYFMTPGKYFRFLEDLLGRVE